MSRAIPVTLLGLLLLLPAVGRADDGSVDLQGLIDDADPGSTLTLESGTHAGGVTIDKPLTISGTDGTVIDGGGSGTVIKVTAPDVTLKHLVIRGSGASLDREDSGISANAPRVTITDNLFEDVLFGIFARSAENSVISGNVVGAKDVFIANRGDGIRLFESEDSIVTDNTISGGRDTVFWFTDRVVVKGNQISDGRYGLHFMYSDGATIEQNILTRNSVGAFMMYSRDVTVRDNVMAENFGPSGYGLGLKDMDRVAVEGNRFIGNRVGMYFDNTPYSHDEFEYIIGNLFAYNRTGVVLQPSVKRNVFSGNAFIDNAEQVGVQGTGSFSGNEWSMDGVGNYWSDFAGYDADGNGIGDVSYLADDLYNTLSNSYPELQFYQETPAARAITIAAEMFPVLRPRPLVEDAFPLVDQPNIQTAGFAETTSLSRALLLTSVVMLAAAAGAVFLPSPRRRRHQPGSPA